MKSNWGNKVKNDPPPYIRVADQLKPKSRMFIEMSEQPKFPVFES